MTLLDALGLAAAAAAAGGVNAVAGGGTIITFPALLAIGTPPLIANATSTVALVIGTSGSVFGFREHLGPARRILLEFAAPSILGGLAGAWLLTRTSNEAFAKLVPFLILFATVLFLFQGAVRKLQLLPDRDPNEPAQFRHALAISFQFVVSVYGGYFGAGIGILMLAWLGFLGLRNIHQMNTVKTVLGSLINLVAAVWFAFAMLVDWQKAAIMTTGAVLGYFLGAHYSQRISQQMVRHLITLIGFAISGITFYRQFAK